MPFGRLLVVGAGLLGTSVALAAKRRWPGVHLTALDATTRSHAPFDVHLDPEAPLPAFDLAVLAVPVDAYAACMRRLAREAPGSAVTDVGSVKRRPHLEAAAAGLTGFVGGHPMAGGSRPGAEHARATLFDDRPWFLTRGDAPEGPVALARALADGCGARVIETDPDSHDATVAAISHLPQAVASVLMATVAEAADDAALAAAAGGLRDSTRIAEGPVGMWQPVFASNADRLAPLVRATAARLLSLADQLDDPAAVRALFAAANAGRRRLPPL
ncbi:MAG: prephenate dehydrogenase/arogenate dehydrogenase family protein [Acidobacteria bacterium]|nr:prephenate dehydrogenase/arogenate dehydrogenase family protein [Acidobacteriota bacterium]